MFNFKLKQGQSVDIEKIIKAYIEKNYGIYLIHLIKFFYKLDKEAYAKIEDLIKNLAQSRLILIDGVANKDPFKYIQTGVSYLQLINSMKNKINFGKDSYSLTIDFKWRDTLADENYSSNSIHFEYYAVLFNMGIQYFELGKSSLSQEDNDQKLKEGVNQFQTAAWIFDRIKEQYQLYFQSIQPDLQMSYMSFVI